MSEVRDIGELIVSQRMRKLYSNIDSLAESIVKYGMFTPILINENNELLAGGRRYQAAKKLGLPQVPVLVISADLLRAKELEFEENVQREDFTWQERVDAIAELRDLRIAVLGQASTAGQGYSVRKLAKELKKSVGLVQTDLSLNKAIKQNPALAKCKTRDEAVKMMVQERANELKNELLRRSTQELKTKQLTQKLLHTNCTQWTAGASASQFDIVLTDPPYGIGIEEANVAQEVAFDDTEKTWNNQIEDWLFGIDKVAKPDAHLYIFHSPDGWKRIQEILGGLGWSVDPKPIIWVRNISKDGKVYGGRVRTADRRFGMSYEMITFASRGLKVLQKQGQPNVILDIPGLDGREKIHPTEKPVKLLTRLLSFSMLPGDKVFDPFVGSGATLEACDLLGLTGLGLEQEESTYATALNRISLLCEHSIKEEEKI